MAGQNVITASSISPQALVSQQLGTTETALYTVPAATSVKVAQGTICNVSSLTPAPTLTLGSSLTTGGTFAAGTYYWKIIAQSQYGQTLGSNEVTATLSGSTSSQALSWTAVPGATSYSVVRGTAAGAETGAITTIVGTGYTDTGSAALSTIALPTVSTFTVPAIVYLSVVKAGGTIGDGTHRILHGYTLAGNDTLPLKDIIGGAMLGPGDIIAGYTTAPNAVDIVLTGTVHA